MIELVNITSYGTELCLHHGGGKRSTVRGVYDFYTRESEAFKRHTFRGYSQRRDAEAELKSKGVQVYEADVMPIRRWLIDNQADVKVTKPNAVYLDFETDSRQTIRQMITGNARVVCWTIRGKEDGVIQTGMLDGDTDADEGELLLRLWKALRPYDQVLSWNGGVVAFDILKTDDAAQGFDFYVLIRRSHRLGVLPNGYDRLLYCDHLSVFRKNHISTGDRSTKNSFGLNAVGRALLGRGKTGFDSKNTWEAWSAGGKQRQELQDYNIEDVQLEYDIEKKTDYLSVFQSICEATWNFPETASLQSSKQVDGLVLAYGARRGIHFPTKPKNVGDRKEKAFAGAVVDGPYVHGIEERVAVADYRALYPSVIISLNISPETLGGKGSTAPIDQESLDKYGVIEPVTFSTDTIGVLPECLIHVGQLRDHHKKRAKEFPVGSEEERDAAAKSAAYKSIINSFYGWVCSERSRYFTVKTGLAVTRTGVTLIKSAQRYVQSLGWKNLYTDTDSLFAKGHSSFQEFREKIAEFNNNILPKMATDWGCRENRFYLDAEKEFSKVLFSYDPSEEEYTKKKYIYRLSQKGGVPPRPGSEIGYTGIELRRGDSTELAAELLERIVNLLMSENTPQAEEFERIVHEARLYVMHTKHDVSKIAITKAVKEELDTYVNDKSPHIIAARMAQARGRNIRPGDKVSYFVAVGSPSHPEFEGHQRIMLAEDFTGTEADLFYTWQSSVYPPSYRILRAAFPGDSRFDKYLGDTTAAAIRYTKAERCGQLRIDLPI